MVTKAELSRQRTDQMAEEAEQAKLDAQEAKQEAAKEEAEDMGRVETMLDTSLGELLEAANAEGLTTIRLGTYHVWRLSETQLQAWDTWDRYFGYQSPLNFYPKKGYPPTTRLVQILEQAGFHVSLDWSRHSNSRSEPTSDGGFTFEKEPGTHIVYYLRIDWND